MRNMVLARSRFVICCLVLTACSGSGKSSVDSGGWGEVIADTVIDSRDYEGDTAADALPEPDMSAAEIVPGDGAGEADVNVPDPVSPLDRAGWIQVIESVDNQGAAQGYRIEAQFWAGPLPTTQVAVEEAGDCVLLQGAQMMGWNCDPECAWGEEACIGGECVPYPLKAPAGVLTVSGLVSGETVSMSPLQSGDYSGVYESDDDLFEPGQQVTVSAAGGELTPEFSLVARGVEALELHPDKYHFEPGDDATIAWTAGTDPAARIQVLLMTGWHGSPNLTTIWCETEDDGELIIPASLTEDFPIPSCGECEGSLISRFTRDTVDFGKGPIELFVASRFWFVAWWGW